MPRHRKEGWIFDCYPEPGGVRVWMLGRDGTHWDFLDPWRAPFYFSGRESDVRRGVAALKASGLPVSLRRVERLELFLDKSLPVVEARLPPLARDAWVARLKRLGLDLHSADMHLIQAYHYDRGHFPLAFCAVELDDAGGGEVEGGAPGAYSAPGTAGGEYSLPAARPSPPRLGSCVSGGGWELRDDPWAIDYELPPMRTLRLSLSGSDVAGRVDPNHAPRGRLVLSYEGLERELDGPLEEQLETLARRIREWDPDVLETEWGDGFLLPRLQRTNRGPCMPWSRDPARGVQGRGERSFYTYGRAVYQGGALYFHGRWHLDVKNSFMLRETGLGGLLEIARVAKIPVQRAARCTIGTALSSMQMDWAWRRGVLIPMDKQQAEDFRPASEFLVADKGGLVYEPEIGWHENVAEYDFTSMYPTVMVRHNISPETVNCPCCAGRVDARVPEIGHHTCRRRRGLVPSVLEPILEKRARYKALAKAGGPDANICKNRASAFKWALVCCFGYLGFKNARFGKIEAHECVNAWGREVLLRAKEAAERRGFHVLHALVDSLWIRLETASGKEKKDENAVEELRVAIEREAGCPLGLEGVYKWIRFCPSKVDALAGVPARYFGAFLDGSLKLRGIACRRRDTPPLLKEMQDRLLRRLARADDPALCRAALPELEEIVEDYRLRIKEGRVSAPELALTFHLSKAPEEYVHDTVTAVAAKQLAASGVRLHPGESVRYVIVDAKEKVRDWRVKPLALMEGPLEYDPAKYLELLERCAREILEGLPPPPGDPRRELI